VNVAGTGAGLAILSGVLLLATKASEYAHNPYLLPKFVFIVLALLNLSILHLTPSWRAHRGRELTQAEYGRLRFFGATSLLFWLGAITFGRLIGYW
jgi:hypothetical protein